MKHSGFIVAFTRNEAMASRKSVENATLPVPYYT
jgi:hypothetical protein